MTVLRSGQSRRSNPERRVERLIALAAAGLLAFNYPLLFLFSVPAQWLGVPVLYLYLFTVWAVFIGLAAWALETHANDKAVEKPRHPEP